MRPFHASCSALILVCACSTDGPSATKAPAEPSSPGSDTAVDEDCPDRAPGDPERSEDGDCDGVPTADDCDDADPMSTVRAEDADCDGALTAIDCNDADPEVGAIDLEAVSVELDGSPYRRICAHSFEMGCTAGQSECESDELPVMPVTISYSYHMAEYEVTQAEFEALMGYNPSGYPDRTDSPLLPVESVSAFEAEAYANALSEQSGLEPCYSCSGTMRSTNCRQVTSPAECAGYRLPTEAEWEAAARCGSDFLYAGSNDADAVAWHQHNRTYDGPHVGGTMLPNGCGLYDMSGNIYEWVQDLYREDYYTADGRTDPTGSDGGELQVRRGGCWTYEQHLLRVSARLPYQADVGNHSIGFRLARTEL